MQSVVPDEIIDAQHLTQYLSYSATRSLLSRQGVELPGGKRLGSVSRVTVYV